MDPVSHVILGRTVIGACETLDRTRFGRGAAVAAMLGALGPDIDCVLMPAGWDIYLRFHEVGTHSLLGGLLVGCAAAALIRACVRGSSFAPLAAAGAIGAVSHLALDVMSGARLGLGWPIVDVRITWPLVAMAEPSLIALLALGAVALWLGRRQLPRVARIVLAVVAMYLGTRAVLYAAVKRIADEDAQRASGMSQAIEARWGSWRTWTIFEKDQRLLMAWQVDVWSGARELVFSWPVTPEPPLVAASRSLDTVRNFLDVHDLTLAVQRTEDDTPVVLWSDVRYCSQPRPGASDIFCGLWFGGAYGADGQALRQEVHVGTWIQTRPVGR